MSGVLFNLATACFWAYSWGATANPWFAVPLLLNGVAAIGYASGRP